MPNNWKPFKLGSISNISGGKRIPKGENLVDYPTAHPYIRVRDMHARTVKKADLLYVPNSAYKKISNYVVSKNDVIISVVGTIGNIAIIDDKINGANLTENCNKISELKNLEPNYLYYFLKSSIGQYEISKGVVGSTQPKLPLYSIKDISITLPPLQEQKAIASILSALDDKIENNLAMNKTLEDMAMTLYRHWFVDFGPFTDSEFVDSELGSIPKGWEVKRLEDYWKLSQYGYTESSSTEIIGPKFLRITDIQGGTIEWDKVPYCPINEKNYYKYRVLKGDIFVARTGNSTGENTYVLNPPESVFASYLIRFQFDDLTKACFVAKTFRSKQFFDFIDGAKVGSAQPGISASTLGTFNLITPPESILRKFYEQVHSIDQQREQNLIENQTLIHLRDTLLPPLISGEVRLEEFQETLANVL